MRAARADELTDGAVHEYLVLYPSGSSFRIRGVFGVLMFDGDRWPTIRTEDQTRTVLDPRAVLARDGLVIHDPRRWVNSSSAFARWLDQHPEWPRVATEAAP